jgi:hypothetical protein
MTFYSCSLVSVEMSNERAIRTRWLEHCFHQLGCFDALCQQTTLAEVIVLNNLQHHDAYFHKTRFIHRIRALRQQPRVAILHMGMVVESFAEEGSRARRDGAGSCTYQAPTVWSSMIHAVLRQVSKVRPTPQI